MTLLRPRFAFALLGTASLALVLGGVLMTRWLHLEPCPLCMFQRLLYLVVAGGALVVVAWPRALFGAGPAALLAALGGLATAAYQSWMQAFPAFFMECGVGIPDNPIEHLVDWLGRQIPWLFYAWGDCTSREWVFLDLSLANWSAIFFLAMSLFIAAVLWRAKRH